jgi:hypothetical protein
MNIVHRGSRYVVRSVLALSYSAALAGCASFNSMPDPVFPRARVDKAIASLTDEEIKNGMAAATDKKQYRNDVIRKHLKAADAHYLDFLISLSKEMRGANFLLDVAALGLSSISAIAHGAANELSTASAIATGTRGSLNKEVYFEKTMPAIVSAMEARRLKVLAQIERRMREDDLTQYSVEDGLGDVMRYQMAMNLDGAIQEITSAAGAKEAQAQQEYQNATQSCSPPTALRPIWAQINDRVYDLAEDGQPTGEKLAAVAAAVGAEKKTDSNEQAAEITLVASRKCKVADAEAMLALIPAK